MWLDRLDTEHDNLRVALTWTLARDAEAALRLAGALGRFWAIRGYLSEGRDWAEQALAGGDDVPATVRARALLAAGHMADMQSDQRTARARHGTRKRWRSPGRLETLR